MREGGKTLYRWCQKGEIFVFFVNVPSMISPAHMPAEGLTHCAYAGARATLGFIQVRV